MSKRYRAGLIGCGAMSQPHLAALQSVSTIEIVALADIADEKLQAAGKQWNVSHLYTNFEEMLARESLDWVTISTQAPVHCPATLAAAESGVKAVLCEKPMALDLVEADQMVAACQEKQVTLAVNHQMRVSPGSWEMTRLLKEGAIGHLKMVCAHDKGGRPAGNSLMEIGTHLFDLMRLYAGDTEWVYGDLVTTDGRPATSVDIMHSQQAYSRDRDCGLVAGERAFALFGFVGGVRGTYEMLGSKPASGMMYGIDLIGDEGRLVRRGGFDASLWLYRGNDWNPDRPMEIVWRNADRRDYSQDAGIAFMVADVLESMEEGREPACSGLDGRAALEMVMGIYESHRLNARIMLPPEDRSHPLSRWREQEVTVGW
ncbi:MAG: Gfo/Idh/MocA family oxidoreductase [Armatimonadetes bacterium]|nr:Gfo/Idh/MocA family oxidoreductase [Armatimonadota bacterium]